MNAWLAEDVTVVLLCFGGCSLSLCCSRSCSFAIIRDIDISHTSIRVRVLACNHMKSKKFFLIQGCKHKTRAFMMPGAFVGIPMSSQLSFD